MAAKKPEFDVITTAVPKAEEKPEEVRVRIKLPAREDDNTPGVKVDLYEHVTIANELGEQNVRVKRGEYVDVTIPVFIQLKQRYSDI